MEIDIKMRSFLAKNDYNVTNWFTINELAEW